jgi:Ni2+-binding GTPase involved in maturation of urease and hydrogenase
MVPLIVVAGYPSSGKTALLRRLIPGLSVTGRRVASAELRCDPPPPGAVPPGPSHRVAVDEDYCPDHALARGLDELLTGAQDADVLALETAGLCARCSPFPTRAFGIFTVDLTGGLHLPGKVGPMLETCDLCVCTRPDRLTGTERTLFEGALRAVSPDLEVVYLNGLTGEGARGATERVSAWLDQGGGSGDLEMRRPLPQFFCSFCLGRTEVGILQA